MRTLRDTQQFEDEDGVAAGLGISSASWSTFGVLWESARVLARSLVAEEVAGRRILEIGCGIGLASLLLNHRRADITATDHHPLVQRYLDLNAALNNDPPIPFVRTAWLDPRTALGRFDVILGSDLLYEDDHVRALFDFIEQHAAPGCEVRLVDPGRGLHARFSKRMVGLGYSHRQRAATVDENPDGTFRGQILTYQRAVNPSA